jgi:hypothetical protein
MLQMSIMDVKWPMASADVPDTTHWKNKRLNR